MTRAPVVERDRRHEKTRIAIIEASPDRAQLTPLEVTVALTIRHMLGEVGDVVVIDSEEGDVLRWGIGVEDRAQEQVHAGVVLQDRRATPVHAQESRPRIGSTLGDPLLVLASLRLAINAGAGQHEGVEEDHDPRA